jgi:DMSO/TMAO reductase YedYZ molybdopterin-dependent catalytic subunit
MTLDRRKMLMATAAAAAWNSVFGAEQGEVIPFADTPKFDPAKPRLPWDQTSDWLTPDGQFFFVGHYGYPEVDAKTWKLDISQGVAKPLSFTLDDIRKRPAREYIATMECSGNPPAGGLIGNARWKGTPLAPILKEAKFAPETAEAVFFAADTGTEKIRGTDYKQNFARSLPIAEALSNDVILCYEMNSKPLTANHGAPVRLVVPGHYGVAWVKWLTRIEMHDRKFLGRFMGRDYVTIRGEKRGEETIWRETSVGRMNLKSVPARVVKRGPGKYVIQGAAWDDGTPLRKVEVSIDNGPWVDAKIESAPSAKDQYTWRFWSYEWNNPAAGEHSVSSRATNAKGRVQPAPSDDSIALKKTYWEANQQAVRKVTI